MMHNTKLAYGHTLCTFILLITSYINTNAQNCQPSFSLTPVTSNNAIEWSKFPEFSLPFKIIYNAPRFGDTQSQPLKHGFSQLATFSGSEPGSLTASQRANLWYGVATNSGVAQPWADSKLCSPWGNDTVAYRNYWDNYAATIYDADLVCLDIERMQREDRDILALKSNVAIPQAYRNLSDADFLATYKRDIRWWYAEAMKRFKAKRPNIPVTSYSDVPIRNTWINIMANTWTDWTTNPARTHYLDQDESGKIGGSYYNEHSLLSPSIYYYYGYNNPFGKDYLSYLLFHIEVNRAWSDKPIVPLVWLRIHDSYDPTTPFVEPFVAEATAIFPFFSGAAGLWLWENPSYPGDRQENYAAYEHFIYGLYRLSEFKDMFQGNYELVRPMSARENMELQNPVWRGIAKGNEILIAAQNPYAADNQQTSITLNYKQWTRTVSVTGKEILLCKFDMNDTVTGLEPDATDVYVFANPVSYELNAVLSGFRTGSSVEFTLVNHRGQELEKQTITVQSPEFRTSVILPKLPHGMYFARFKGEKSTITRKVVVAQ